MQEEEEEEEEEEEDKKREEQEEVTVKLEMVCLVNERLQLIVVC
jgi:hypothetical protein